MTFKIIFPLSLLSLAFLCPCPGQSYNILFYYNSGDGTDDALLECVTILQNAGHHVTTVDVDGKNRDPRGDNWGAPYDQVWDMRFVDRDSRDCGSGQTAAPDYFDSRWRSKAVSFLNHCGKLFVAAEYFPYADRDEGIYAFLREIQAVKPGYDSCPPSSRGNSSTTGDGFYKVRNGLGPRRFYGNMVGGIPLAYLTGTNFVDTSADWVSDQVDRSIVSGWAGNQFGGAVTSALCGRGKFFMVWDATMWTLWQPGMYGAEQKSPPIWDDSAWSPGNIQSSVSATRHLREAQEVTLAFFPAVAQWLGKRDFPCTEAALPEIPAPTLVGKGVPISTVFPTESLPALTPTGGSFLSVGATPTETTPNSPGAPSNLVFSDFPVNLYMGFRDGVGEYQLSIWNNHGQLIQTIFDKKVTTEKEAWASWDGMESPSLEAPPGVYFAVLSKDGRFLRKMVLTRTRP